MLCLKKYALLAITLCLLWSGISLAKIFYSKEEAMVLAFGDKAQVESLSLFPDERQTQKIQEMAKVKLDSGMFTFYVGKENGKVTGYAAIETTTVRTKPETLMIVLTPEGKVNSVHTLAFHEPPEYQPPESWFAQLVNKPLDELDFSKGVQGISGATLSTRANINSVRKVLAVFQVMVNNPQ